MSAVGIEQESGPGGRRKLRWWHLISPLAALGLIPGIVLAIAISLKRIFPNSAAIPDLVTGDIQRDAVSLLFLMLFSYIVMLGLMWEVARSRGAVPLSGYFKPIDRRTAWLAFGTGLLLVGMLGAIGSILEWTHLVIFHKTKIEALLEAHTTGQLCLTLAVAALFGPIAEEIYFRGLFLVWLRQNWSLPLSAAINVVLFAAIHGNMIVDPSAQGWIATAGIAAVALVNIMWTIRTGSLWAATIVHGTFNGVQVLIVSVPLIFGHG